MEHSPVNITAVPQGKFADIGNGLRVHYHEAGAGPAVMFVHGSGPGATGWSNFKHNYEVLAAAGFRCIVPDLIGYGFSTTDDGVAYSWEMLVGGIKGLCDALGLEKVTLIGNSMGGAMCIQAALDHPELVERMILMAPGGIEDREVYMGMLGIRTMLKILYKSGVTRESMKDIFKLQLYNEDLITDEIIAERFEVYPKQAKNILGQVTVPNLASRLPEIKCPVLGLWGQNDNFTPVSGVNVLMSGLPNVRVLSINKCGHWVMVEHAGLFNRTCIDFLING